MIDKPGIYDLSAAAYHADPCPEPSFSRSIGKLLLTRSPRHAWYAHPRLNPDWQPEDDTKFDVGTAAHDVLLRGDDTIEVINADDYRTKAAKQARDAAKANDRLPVLAPRWPHVQGMVRAARAQLSQHRDAKGAFTNGKPEMTMVWCEGGTWCRARLDWLPNKGPFFDDYKTSVNASPDAWSERACYETGADIQAAFYRRGIRALKLAVDPVFRFAVQEVDPPYCLSVCQLTPAALDMAERKVEAALEHWRWCVQESSWPGYPAQTCYVDPPPWQERRWLEREGREEIARDQGVDLKKLLLDWQAPITPAA